MTKYLLGHIRTPNDEDILFSGTSGDELLILAIYSKDFGLAKKLVERYKTIHSEAVLMALAQSFPSELIKSVQIDHEAARHLLWEVLTKPLQNGSSTNHNYYKIPLFEATKENAFEFVKIFLRRFLNAILNINDDGHNFVQYAVINHSEKVYSLIYQMSEHKNTHRTIRDLSGNNLLHLAARLSPSNKLDLLLGAALQIQRELQWFQEVEGFVCPLNRIQKNSDGETPQMIFTREHKDLVINDNYFFCEVAISSYR